MNANDRVFTVAQIAAALGRSKRGILLKLKILTPQKKIKVRGQVTNAWSLADLPESNRSKRN